MGASQLPISNVINVSVTTAAVGVGEYNTSNLAIFTDDQPANSFPSGQGYGLYETPAQVATDWGTTSTTYALANAIFSQSPNILLGGGQLVIIPMLVASQNILFSAAPASGTFTLTYGGDTTAAINWNDTAATIQTKLQALTGLSNVIVSGSITANTLTVTFYGVYGAVSAMTAASSLNGSITVTPTVVNAGEKIPAAITRTSTICQYFGILSVHNLATIGQTDLLAAAAVTQPLIKMGFFVSNQSADIQPGGMIDQLRSGSFTQTRGLYYGSTTAPQDVVFAASYASLLLSVDFTGSNTTITMNLKQLAGVAADGTVTQTILGYCTASGADCYPSLQGYSAVFTSGANQFVDQVYNALWFGGALQVALFNYLATTNTKIPQTELGMDGMKATCRQVCQQAVANQYVAPGTWTSATTFGNQQDLLNNIAQRGFYIYSSPISNNRKRIARLEMRRSFKLRLNRPEQFRAPRCSLMSIHN